MRACVACIKASTTGQTNTRLGQGGALLEATRGDGGRGVERVTISESKDGHVTEQETATKANTASNLYASADDRAEDGQGDSKVYLLNPSSSETHSSPAPSRSGGSSLKARSSWSRSRILSHEPLPGVYLCCTHTHTHTVCELALVRFVVSRTSGQMRELALAEATSLGFPSLKSEPLHL